MNLNSFRTYIRTVSQADLDASYDQVTGMLRRSRSPASRAGCVLALDALVIESNMRRTAPTAEIEMMSDDELLAELGE